MNFLLPNPEHLIVVPGHAPLNQGVQPDHMPEPSQIAADQHWELQGFQAGEPPFYIDHIKAGVDQLRQDPLSVLMFSGGRTREKAGPWSEAASYLAVAGLHNFWQATATEASQLQKRTLTEEHARDSLENLRFSLGLFYRQYHRLPAFTTVVGWDFKAGRFDQHRQALGIPANRFAYQGVNNPQDLAAAERGESQALVLFQQDPLSENAPLSQKKQQRNPHNQIIPYQDTELLPAIADQFPENQHLRRSA